MSDGWMERVMAELTDVFTKGVMERQFQRPLKTSKKKNISWKKLKFGGNRWVEEFEDGRKEF